MVITGDVSGLCKVATRDEIKAQDWSLNPTRHVRVAPGQAHDDEEFKIRLEALSEDLEVLSREARQLEQTIAQNIADLLDVQ